ncbi:unnamed protein product [Lupinus luteus]|uniref:Uncharacterized protein n=1 Tax=Lupinus luteus TaxID=3873 RepID=A0AAV1X1A0_LUPLU
MTHPLWLHHWHCIWKMLPSSSCCLWRNHFCNLYTLKLFHHLPHVSYGSSTSNIATSVSHGIIVATNIDPSNGRVMLIGTSLIHKSCYKLLEKLHHSHLTEEDKNRDGV